MHCCIYIAASTHLAETRNAMPQMWRQNLAVLLGNAHKWGGLKASRTVGNAVRCAKEVRQNRLGIGLYLILCRLHTAHIGLKITSD